MNDHVLFTLLFPKLSTLFWLKGGGEMTFSSIQ